MCSVPGRSQPQQYLILGRSLHYCCRELLSRVRSARVFRPVIEAACGRGCTEVGVSLPN